MISFTILGACYSLKNSKQLSTRGGRPRIIKHWKVRQFQEDFCRQVPREYRGLAIGALDKPLRTTVTVFYPSQKQDLDCAAIYDCLQVSGVVKNDLYIVEKHEYRAVDRNKPRVEIQVEEL